MREFFFGLGDWMGFLAEPPLSYFLATLLAMLAMCVGWRGTKLFLKGFREPRHPNSSMWLVRGIRAEIVALALAFFVGGLLYAKWLMIFGAIFLAEELYETGFVLLILRWSQRTSTRATG